MTRQPRCAHPRHRPTSGPLGPDEAHRHQLVVSDIGADLAVTGLHPLLHLRQEPIDQLLAPHRRSRQLADVPTGHPLGNRVMVAVGQLAGRSITLRQIERFQNLHDLLGMLHVVPPRSLDGMSTPS